MPDMWQKLLKPVPILQWLVVIVLAAHVLLSDSGYTTLAQSQWYILGLLSGTLILLYVLPKFLPMNTVAAILVVMDTLLVPLTLYLTNTTEEDLLVVYFGIIMIAGASGDLKRALVLASLTSAAYLAFMLLHVQESVSLGMILLRLPFLLAMTLFYGSLAEFARHEQAAKERLSHAALHDELTGMPNRRLLLQTLARNIEEARRFDSPLSCGITDVDEFKHINDTYGHAMGDLVLRDYSSILAVQSRGYDLAGRLGGDEFVWILPRVDRDGAISAGERLREAIERYQFGTGQLSFHATTSIGMTTYVPSEYRGELSPEAMLNAADKALYGAKGLGRNKACHLALSDDETDADELAAGVDDNGTQPA